jgi:glyoxylase-like metal-dependent hydrolase (beta-lactamase superfamily II)
MRIEKNNITIETFQESKFALDGGAMFGVVPKVLWHKKSPGDEMNRINLAANIVLIRHPEYTLLIEQGMGDKWNEKQIEIYNIRQQKSQIEHLSERGVKPEDITHVILTHLHFDHCGGATIKNTDGEIAPTFPNAKYYVQNAQYEEAVNTHERNNASYIPETFIPLMHAGQLELLNGDCEILDGISSVVTGGHTAGHQVIEIDYDDDFKAVFIGDLIPTAHHVNLAWIMGYDLYPNDTLTMKKKLLPKYADEQRLIIFPHEDRFFAGYVTYDEEKKRYRVRKWG